MRLHNIQVVVVVVDLHFSHLQLKKTDVWKTRSSVDVFNMTKKTFLRTLCKYWTMNMFYC